MVRTIGVLGIVFAALLVGCRSTAQTHERNAMECKQVMEQLEKQDFENWGGLTEDCTPEVLAARWGGDLAGAQTHWRGEKMLPASFIGLQVPGYDEPARLWMRDGHTLMLEIEYPDLKQVGALLRALGQPAAQLDYYYGVKLNLGGEYVYPNRGITLFMNTSRENVVKLWVYSPISLESYREGLHSAEEPRELPAPR